MRVKICGLTRVVDGQRASDLGVDAVGLNFWPQSKRFVTLEQGAKIARACAPLVWVVGVFVNAARADIERTIARVGLHAIQLHGDERPADTQGYSVPVLKAVHLSGQRTPRIQFTTPLVLDAQQPGYGGGGVTLDWGQARRIARSHQVLLAGGLTPKNVLEAIEAVGPLGVDVASGVESAPGIKDQKLMTRFIRAVRSA